MSILSLSFVSLSASRLLTFLERRTGNLFRKKSFFYIIANYPINLDKSLDTIFSSNFSRSSFRSYLFFFPRASNEVSFFAESSSFFGRVFTSFLFSKSDGDAEGVEGQEMQGCEHDASLFCFALVFCRALVSEFFGRELFLSGVLSFVPLVFWHAARRVYVYFFFREAEFREERALAFSLASLSLSNVIQ